MDDGRPPPRAGNFFAAIHDGRMRCDTDNSMDERYEFAITLTMRVTVPLDRVGDQQMARNIERVPLGQRQGFYAKTDALRALLHMGWKIVVLRNQTPNSANDNIADWGTGIVYGFCEPMRFTGMEFPKLVGGEWFGSDPESTEMGMKAMLSFGRCRRIQGQTQANESFL